MKLATWNINGLRARAAQLIEWVQRDQPDVLCLQEIKATLDQVCEVFPLADLPGYWSRWNGHPGGYSGVSVHLRKAVFPEAPQFRVPPIDREGRIVEAEAGGRVFGSVYIPNGGKDYDAKLAFLRELGAYVAERRAAGEHLVLSGDMNIARSDQDVYPNQRKDGAIGQRADERALFEAILSAGLVDVGRTLEPTNDRLYTWWPYWRNLRDKNQGWRIDYVLASQDAPLPTACDVLKSVGASDHAPLVATFPA